MNVTEFLIWLELETEYICRFNNDSRLKFLLDRQARRIRDARRPYKVSNVSNVKMRAAMKRAKENIKTHVVWKDVGPGKATEVKREDIS